MPADANSFRPWKARSWRDAFWAPIIGGRNVREPVQFLASVQDAARRGARASSRLDPRRSCSAISPTTSKPCRGSSRCWACSTKDDADADPFRPCRRIGLRAWRGHGDGYHRRRRSGPRAFASSLSLATQDLPSRGNQRGLGRTGAPLVASADRRAPDVGTPSNGHPLSIRRWCPNSRITASKTKPCFRRGLHRDGVGGRA